jgi:hypothetical protein
MSYFEIGMLVCFGIAWPFSIYRSFVSKSTKGKSAVFLIIVIIGYASGILHKIMYSFDGVIWFYAANMFMVIIDAALYYRNRCIENR